MSPSSSTAAGAPSGQFALLGERRFAPFFWTQFLGAGNDNLFKFAFTVLVTYQLQVAWLPPALAGLLIGALFILPFVLLSATSGQLADKLEKSRLMRLVKTMEIAIMAAAAWGFWAGQVPLLLACVLLMGVHSTLFGPVKFAYLPQHLSPRELTGGNGMVEMGTFVAILLGNLAGGLLVAVPQIGRELVAGACLGLAVLGRAAAQRIPVSPASDPALVINWNPVSETWRNLRLAYRDRVVFRSLLGISWMWFFGAAFLSLFPAFAREVLHGDEHVASLLLAVFSIGVGGGSLLCERLSRRQVEIGLVPLGAIGMSVFSIDLWLAVRGLPPAGPMSAGAFLGQPAHWRVMADLALLSMSAGLYSVPMYVLVQLRSPASHRARMIAANNILNALFMIASALAAGLLLQGGWTIPEVFLAVGLANAAVTGCIFLLVPDYLLRFFSFVLSRCVYRLRVSGGEHIPAEGPAILVCNRARPVDALLLTAASPRPIRFLIDRRALATPVLGTLLRRTGAIPLPPAADVAGRSKALDEARRTLREGSLIGVFTDDSVAPGSSPGTSGGGLMSLLETDPVPVVPLALHDMRPPTSPSAPDGREPARPLRSRVSLVAGAPMAPAQVTLQAVQGRVRDLLAT